MRIILGSKSPRRKALLSEISERFEIIPPETDESVLPGEDPAAYAERAALEKAESIYSLIDQNQGSLIISCDTIVCVGNEIFGKPSNRDQAFSFLRFFSGRTHTVISSLCIMKISEGSRDVIKTGTEKTVVTFHHLDDNAIEKYLSITHYMDKAGAYAAQENGDMIIKEINGSFTNVIGLPMRLLIRMLMELDVLEKI